MDRPLRARPPWWAAAWALGTVAGAMALALELPRSFSDPNGLDPHVLRLAVVSVAVAAASLAGARLAGARAVLLAVAGVSVSFSAFSLTPGLLSWLAGGRLSGDARLLWASGVQAAVTLVAIPLVGRAVPSAARPDLRLGRFGLGAALWSLGGLALIIPVGLAIPAALLGRDGIAVQAVARDLPWLAPACALQAFAQELQFRGLLLGALERVAPPVAANLSQAALFGVAHLAIQYPGPSGPFIPVTLVFGAVLGLLVQRTASLWPAVIIHAAADIAITVAVLPGLYGT